MAAASSEQFRHVALAVPSRLACALVLAAGAAHAGAKDERPAALAAGSFGIAPSGESGGELPRILPMLREAGVTMLRAFPEWSGIQPSHGQWNWSASDRLVAMARENEIRLLGIYCYLAPWASSGGTRRFPIKDIRYWREYVEGVTARYKDDILHWEVYNEFNSGAFAQNATPKDYAELVRVAWEAAKKANPACKIGMGCASVAVAFLEQTIQAGAGGCFDFVAVHPYELLEVAMSGREPTFLRMAPNLRAMLKKNGQRDDIELWVTEIGYSNRNEREQAEAVAKAFVLSLAQGIEKVFWFEARGPYNLDLIRGDWSKRPSYTALQTMTRLLGPAPKSLGWYNPTGKSYGFVFQGAREPVLVAWAMKEEGDVLTFGGDVNATDLAGDERAVRAGEALRLTRAPVFVTRLPASLVAKARSDGARPMPWLQDYGKAESVSCHTGAENVESGLCLLKWGDGNTVAGLVDGIHVRRTDKARGMNYIYFDVDDSYAAVGDSSIEITVVARAVDPAKRCELDICYESRTGYRNTEKRWTLPSEPGWHERTFSISDANFANTWGWNFRIDVGRSQGDVWVKEVVVKRLGARN